MQKYIDDVLDGKVLASKPVVAICERHLKDLERQNTTEFPYHFDHKRAATAVNFYPAYLRHSVGRYAGLPFQLEPWQIFCEASIFGWLREDGTRRFRTTYESKGRKNGKSTRIAGRAILLARYDHNPIAGNRLNLKFCPEPVAQVVLAATKREQADKVLYAEISRMRRGSKRVRSGSQEVNRHIRFFRNDGEIFSVGSDKPYDGLNPHFVALDEIHAWREYHREFYDTMMTGAGFRDQPLASFVTTAGSDQSYLWIEIYNYAKAVALGTIDDDSYFTYIAELDEEDDPLDEDKWIKANPNIDVSVSREFLREQAKKAKASPLFMNQFDRYHCNRQVTAVESAFNMDLWKQAEGELSDWSKADAVGIGVDLGGRDDLAAAGFVARFRDGDSWRYEAKAVPFLHSTCQRDLRKQPWVGWVGQGLLKVSGSPISDMLELVAKEGRKYGCRMVAYDPYTAQQFAEQIKLKGMEPVRVSQSPVMFTEPIDDLQKVLRDGLFRHNGCPLLGWCASNTVLVCNAKGQKMYDKASSSEKIDPIVAMTMAFRMASLARSAPTGSLIL